MHEAALSRAALPAATRIAGIELRPYSLGHELFLIRENSPFIFGGTVQPGDIFEAILICSATFDGLKRARESFLYLPILWLLKRRVSKCNLELAEKSLQEYRESGCLELPISDNIRPERINNRDPGTPFILRLHQFLVLKFRLTESEAWDYPVGLAKMRWAAFWEQEGGLDVQNWFDAHIEEVKRKANEVAA
jgi:hypothetical protein